MPNHQISKISLCTVTRTVSSCDISWKIQKEISGNNKVLDTAHHSKEARVYTTGPKPFESRILILFPNFVTKRCMKLSNFYQIALDKLSRNLMSFLEKLSKIFKYGPRLNDYSKIAIFKSKMAFLRTIK